MNRSVVIIVLVAAFGGVLTNLIDIATGLQANPPQVPTPTYWLGCLLWAIGGIVVALVWGERKDLKKVLYLGMGFPAILQLNVSNLSDNRSAMANLVPNAFAQPPATVIEGRTLHVSKTSGSPTGDGYRVVFFGPTGVTSTRTLQQASAGVAVPPDAQRVAVEYRGARSATLQLPTSAGATARISVGVKTQTWSGFLRALGVRNASKYIVVIRSE